MLCPGLRAAMLYLHMLSKISGGGLDPPAGRILRFAVLTKADKLDIVVVYYVAW
jgi:hypothetical protein